MTALSVLLICVFVQVALTFWAIASMGVVRVNSHKAREVSLGDVALDSGAYPKSVTPYTNNTNNQFQTPILLYTLVGLAAATAVSNWIMVVGAVMYILSRLMHRMIHVGSNNVNNRFMSYLVGLVGLAVGWVAYGFELLF